MIEKWALDVLGALRKNAEDLNRFLKKSASIDVEYTVIDEEQEQLLLEHKKTSKNS